MSKLTDCFGKLNKGKGKLFSDKEIREITALANSLHIESLNTANKLSPQQAEVKAVQEALDQAMTERMEISDLIYEAQGGKPTSKDEEKIGSIPAPEAAAPQQAKEPWEMTRVEWNAYKHIPLTKNDESNLGVVHRSNSELIDWAEMPDGRKAYRNRFLDGREPTQWEFLEETGRKELTKEQHKDTIVKALQQNKPVPAEVLADYPELTKQAEQPAKPQGMYELQQIGAVSGEWKTVQKYNTQAEADAALPKGSGWRITKPQGKIDQSAIDATRQTEQPKELVKRWRGGSDKGMTEVAAKIQLTKLHKDQPELQWEIAPIKGIEGRYEALGYAKLEQPNERTPDDELPKGWRKVGTFGYEFRGAMGSEFKPSQIAEALGRSIEKRGMNVIVSVPYHEWYQAQQKLKEAGLWQAEQPAISEGAQAKEQSAKQEQEKPGEAKGNTSSQEDVHGYGITKSQAENLAERAFNVWRRDWGGEGFNTWREMLASEDGANDLGEVVHNESELYHRFTNLVPEKDAEGYEFTANDVFKALKNGELPDSFASRKAMPDIAIKPTQAEKLGNLGEPSLYPEMNGEDQRALFERATQRQTKSNHDEVAKARYEVFMRFNTGSLDAIQAKDVLAKLKTWSNYSKAALNLHTLMNAGKPIESQWFGILNMSYLSQQQVSSGDIDALVKSVTAPDKSWNMPDGERLRKYIARAMLGIDTRIEYKDLKFIIESTLKPLGQYSNWDRTITIRANSPNTVAHEIGHYLDYKWGREAYPGIAGAASEAGLTKGVITQHSSELREQWMAKFAEFVHDLADNSEIGSSYLQDRKEVFARFVDRFISWTANKAGVREFGENRYSDKFTEMQFRKFVRLLQEKAYVDIADGNPNGKSDARTRDVTAKPKETDKGVALFSQSAAPVRNPHTLATLKAAINSAFSHAKDFAGLLEATGKVHFISKAQVGEYLNRLEQFHPFGEDSLAPQGATQSVALYAKRLSDAVSAQSFIDKGYSALDVKTKGIVEQLMLAIGHNQKILDSIVKFIPVDVMDALVSRELTPEMIFNDPLMFERGHAIDGDSFISIPVNISSGFVRGVAQWAAKYGNRFDLTLGPPERSPAIRASNNRGIIKSPAFSATVGSSVSGYMTLASGKSGSTKGTIDSRHDVTPYSNVGLEAPSAETGGASSIIKAFVKDGNVFFIYDNISQADDNAKGLVLHEIALHALQLGRTDAEFQAILKQIETLRKMGNKQVQAARDRVPADTQPDLVLEEQAGYLLEQSPGLSVVQKLIARFRALLRKIGASMPMAQRMQWFRWANALNESDIVFLASEVMRNAPKLLGNPSFEIPYGVVTNPNAVSDRAKIIGVLGGISDKLNISGGVIGSDASGFPDSGAVQSGGYGSARATKMLSDLTKRHPAIMQGFGGINVKTQKLVFSYMIGMAHDTQILDSVIKLIPVDVMNNLGNKKFSSNIAFNNKAMLKNISSVVPNELISSIADPSTSAIANAFARIATELSESAGGAFNNFDWTSANGAGDKFSGSGPVDAAALARAETNFLSSAASTEFNSALRAISDRHGVAPIYDNSNIIRPDMRNMANLLSGASAKVTSAGIPLFSQKAYNENYEVQPDSPAKTALDDNALRALRRAAAGIESPERGITFTINADGKAIVTGPARTKVPTRFQRFANEHGLTLRVQRASGRYENANAAMPSEYREAGALYFGEIGDNHLDRTGLTRFSRAPAQPTKEQPRILRMAKKSSMEEDVSMVDRLASAPFKLIGWNRIIEPAIDRLMERAGEFIPEKVKAGLASDYGLGDDYTDRKAEMKSAEAAQNRKSAGLVEMLAALTRAESRVAYQWMQEKPDTTEESRLLEKLPAESRETLKRLKQLISDMGAEAVRLGQLSPEAFQRNNMAYLHRTYAKHVLEPMGVVSRMMRALALRIKGTQYKGRGIFDEVKMDHIGGDQMFWRKLQDGRADKSLVGEKLIRFERRDASAEAMDALPGMSRKQPGKLKDVIYWPANEPIPAKFGDWVDAGTFEARGTNGDKLVVWRDFTKEERQRMGELDEVRYAVAQTLQMMTHDIEVGRFFAWAAKKYGKANPEGKEADASESMLRSYGKDEWVRVPAATIPGTQVRKYGALAGLYIPGPIWNDIRQTAGTRIEPFGHAHEKVLQFWKKSKTAWSPAVHTNNVMANFVIADWHDLRATDLAEALKVWANNKKDGYRQMYERFEDSGALGGMFLSNEALRDEIASQLESIKAELTGEQDASNEMTRMAKVMHLVTQAGMVPVKGAKAYTQGAEAAYQFEDAIFRFAAFLKAVRYGKTDIEAGRIARHSFLNYDINAPWIQMARHTALPFISFFYRALPMALNTVKSKPWKVLKLLAFWHLVSMIGYMASGGDEDEERKLLPKEKRGSVWGVVPKMVRMPWNHDGDAPVFLDIRRWVPVGDVVDLEMGSGMLPPWATPSGVIPLLAEVLIANKALFTEKDIVGDSDTQTEKLEKRLDHLFKGFMPNVPIPNPLNLHLPIGEVNPFDLTQGSLQPYAWAGIERSALKREGNIGEVRTTAAALVSSLGIKVAAYPAANMEAAKAIELRRNVMEIKDTIKKIQRDFSNLESPTKQERARYERDIEKQRKKIEKAVDGL